MELSFQSYKDKVMGCWAGKNIGGVLGAPFEGRRMKVELDYYTQDLSMGPPPNDDLDLQIVWLAAVEKYGRNVNASILGEYWLSYIIPNWVEYGTGKANLRAGFVPPMAGALDNTYKDSCGCFIRSELWACLAPGHPDLAVRYAYEDAIVDHADEGMLGEVFFAALESAAFVEQDKNKLLDIALSYIPADSAVARGVKKARECYEKHMDFFEARREVHNCVPGTFGIQGCKISEIDPKERDLELGAPGFDAPENIAYAMMGWLYGEDDFGKALCLSVSCGEDTDCSGASLGALLGILRGASNIPEKWTAPLNDKIATLCIDKTSGGIWVPETVTELTDRILRVTPMFLGIANCDLLHEGGYTIFCKEGEALYCEKEDYIPLINGNGKNKQLPVNQLTALSPYVARYEHTAFYVMVDYQGSVNFTTGENRTFRVQVTNSGILCQQQWVKMQLYLPEGVTAVNGSNRILPLNNLYMSKAEAEFELNFENFHGARMEAVLDISLEGRHSNLPVKIVLVRNA